MMHKYIVHCLFRTFRCIDTPKCLESPCLIAGLSLLYQGNIFRITTFRNKLMNIFFILKTYETNIGQKTYETNRYCHLKLIMGHIPFGETPPGRASYCSDLVGDM
jgi:hypothetical protein